MTKTDAQQDGAESATPRTYWLIERIGKSPAEYLVLDPPKQYAYSTDDPLKATKFYAQWQADSALSDYLVKAFYREYWHTTEHMDCSGYDDAINTFKPDWANYKQGRQDGLADGEATRADLERALTTAKADGMREAALDAFSKVCDLIEGINQDRWGKPLIVALHLCNDLADELYRAEATRRAADELNKHADDSAKE